MSQYNDTLHSMAWQVEQLKPNSSPNLRAAWINAAIREALDERPYWAGTLQRSTIYIPGAYSAGAVDLTNGSDAISGSGMTWPVSDRVNTTLATAVRNVGWNVVQPASMAGITADTVLLVDSGEASEETVAVVEVSKARFRANFRNTHDAGATLTCSSFAGRQFKFGATAPIYTLRAVKSATSGLLDVAWAGATAASVAYQLLQMYVTIDTAVKRLMKAIDPSQPDDLVLDAPRGYIDARDPQRTDIGTPQFLVDYVPNECGNQQWELWPASSSERHLYVLWAKQWPDLKAPDDSPPYFINPQIFVDGALSRALRTKVEAQDPYVDQRTADFHELKFQTGKKTAASADNSKAQQAFSMMYTQARGGSDWRQQHDYSEIFGE